MKKRAEKLPARRSLLKPERNFGGESRIFAQYGTGYIISPRSYQDLMVWPGMCGQGTIPI